MTTSYEIVDSGAALKISRTGLKQMNSNRRMTSNLAIMSVV